jgi:hypothetical protein
MKKPKLEPGHSRRLAGCPPAGRLWRVNLSRGLFGKFPKTRERISTLKHCRHSMASSFLDGPEIDLPHVRGCRSSTTGKRYEFICIPEQTPKRDAILGARVDGSRREPTPIPRSTG